MKPSVLVKLPCPQLICGRTISRWSGSSGTGTVRTTRPSEQSHLLARHHAAGTARNRPTAAGAWSRIRQEAVRGGGRWRRDFAAPEDVRSRSQSPDGPRGGVLPLSARGASRDHGSPRVSISRRPSAQPCAQRDHIIVLRSSRRAETGSTRSSSSTVVRPSRSLARASVAIE